MLKYFNFKESTKVAFANLGVEDEFGNKFEYEDLSKKLLNQI
jgi:hypothetical protein